MMCPAYLRADHYAAVAVALAKRQNKRFKF